MGVAHRGRRLSERSQSIAKAGIGRRLLVGAHRHQRCPRAGSRRPRVFLWRPRPVSRPGGPATARRLGVAEATAIYYTQRHARQRISARRTIIACLAGAGLRNTELCRTDIRDVDFAHGTINVADAKTEAGVRKLDLSPMLRDELLAWRASLHDPTPEGPLFPTRAGSRRDDDNTTRA